MHLLIASFIFLDNGDLYGTTTEGVPFSQIEVSSSPRTQVFTLGGKKMWHVTSEGIIK